MTAITMIMVAAFSQLSGNPDVVDKARSQLGSGSFSLSDYRELVSSEKTVPQNRLQEWLVIRGLYAWALALRKPTKEQESNAVAEAKECLTRAKGMGRIEIRQICPGDCWEFVPAAAKVYWNELPDVGSTTSQPDETHDEFRNQKQSDAQKAETAERRLQDVENRRKQADTELRALSELLSQKRNLLSELDAQLKAKQQELIAKQEEIDKLSAVLLNLRSRIAEATATKPSAATMPAEPRISPVRTGAAREHATEVRKHVLRGGQVLCADATTEALAGSIEWVTFHNPDNAFAVVRVKTRKLHLGPSSWRRLAISAGLQPSPEAHRLKRAGCGGRPVFHWESPMRCGSRVFKRKE